MDMAWATMLAGSLVEAGSRMVLPVLAICANAARYCSATRRLAACAPPCVVTASDTRLRPLAVASARL